jgi:transcriptional regulator with XRE-family HTH domain
LLKMTQKELSDAIGSSQKDVSLLESGKKSFIPNEYIQYLYTRNIDINSLYQEDGEVRFNTDSNIAYNSEKGSGGIVDIETKKKFINLLANDKDIAEILDLKVKTMVNLQLAELKADYVLSGALEKYIQQKIDSANNHS